MQLCKKRWERRSLAYETTNQGLGWYLHHHHHLHISLKQTAGSGAPTLPGVSECLVPGCGAMDDRDGIAWGDGVADPLKRPMVNRRITRLPGN
jgi:hypothetical protein